MAHEPGSTILACIGQLRLSMEGRQRTRCLHPGASQQGKLLADGPSPRAMPAQTRVVPARPGLPPRRSLSQLAGSIWLRSPALASSCFKLHPWAAASVQLPALLDL